MSPESLTRAAAAIRRLNTSNADLRDRVRKIAESRDEWRAKAQIRSRQLSTLRKSQNFWKQEAIKRGREARDQRKRAELWRCRATGKV